MTNAVEQLINETRRKAQAFFEAVPAGASEEGLVESLARLLIEEGAAMTRANIEQIAQATMLVFAELQKAEEGREVLKKVHAELVRQATPVDQVVEETKKRARAFFEGLPRGATAAGTVDALAKLVIEEEAQTTRSIAEKFSHAVMAIYGGDGKAAEGREFLRKVHGHLTGGQTT